MILAAAAFQDAEGCGMVGCCWSGWNGDAKTRGIGATAAGVPVAVAAAAGAEAVADPTAGLALGGAAVLPRARKLPDL